MVIKNLKKTKQCINPTYPFINCIIYIFLFINTIFYSFNVYENDAIFYIGFNSIYLRYKNKKQKTKNKTKNKKKTAK
jgi:hypothetical protein